MEELLRKYIRYVQLCEGSDFILHGIQPYHEAEEAGLTDEDVKTLQRFAKEALDA